MILAENPTQLEPNQNKNTVSKAHGFSSIIKPQITPQINQPQTTSQINQPQIAPQINQPQTTSQINQPQTTSQINQPLPGSSFVKPIIEPISKNSKTKLKKISHAFFHWWHKIAVVLLSVHGLIGFWESIKFVLVDLKDLEFQLSMHWIKRDEVNFLIATAIIVALTTLINIFMAIRLGKTKETTAHNIDLFIATILIVGTNYIQNILIQFDLLNIVINLIQK
ncbi:MAG: hypothetical protein H6772_04905 [Pseudomonadales bacterium]|nr:hypothetical protein [Pseudomonadales bacterium]